jgi:hypothetical protein
MAWSRIAQLIIGITVGLAMIIGASVGAGYLYFNQFSRSPQKPNFPNQDQAAPTPSFSPYAAVVNETEGLLLREQPSTDAKTLKVLNYKQELEVLEDPKNQKFEKVRVKFKDEDQVLEGWVSAGNLDRVEPEKTDQTAGNTPEEPEQPNQDSATPAEKPKNTNE